MRVLLTCLPLALLALPPAPPQATQEPGVAPQATVPIRSNLLSFRKGEKKRLEEELIGTWLLVRYDRRGLVVDQAKVRGFATFLEGYMSMSLELQLEREVIFGRTEDTHIQSGVYRYRISESTTLQSASVMGFSNAERGSRIYSEPTNYPREYEITLVRDELSLRRLDGDTLTFRRVNAGAFPQKAIDLLDRTRGREITGRDWNDFKNR